MEDYQSTLGLKDDIHQKNDTNWFSGNAQVISSNVQNIKERAATVRRLLLHMQTSQNDDQTFQKLQEIQHNTTELARSTSRKIKRLNGLTKNQINTNLIFPVDESEALQSEQHALVEDFSDAIRDLQSVQHLTSQMHQDVSQSYHMKTNTGNVEGIANDKQDLKLKVIRQKSFDKDDKSIRVLQDRQRAFEELEHDIACLNYILRELHKMSETQRDVLCQFEENVNDSSINIDRGAGMLRTAKKTTKQIRKKKLFLIYISVIALILVGVVVVLIIVNKTE